MIDEKMSKALEHVGATAKFEDVVAEFISRTLEGMQFEDLYELADCYLAEEYKDYTKAQLREELECYGHDDLLQATDLWKHEKGDE